MIGIALLIIYMISLLFIFLFSMGQLHLTWHYLLFRKKKRPEATALTKLPAVTVQLPLFNEKYVAGRLIDSVCALEYPRELLEIQVLDDSEDQTVEVVAARVRHWKERGLDITQLRRPERTGFKAGALAYGHRKAKGEYIAVFDADFLPGPGFLQRTLPLFDKTTGVVQTRWGHLNRNYSLLTRLQAFGLDAHFTVEQNGRSHAGSFINFNGTAGVWRAECIDDAGGWSADTLTEDLDLSYRAQLRGWKFKYLEECVAPAELPVMMGSIKSQQYRWNKGAAETARKNLGNVMRSSLSLTGKTHAFFHLLNSSVFVSLLLAALVSVPVLFLQSGTNNRPFLYAGSVFLLGFFSIGFFYWVAYKRLRGRNFGDFIKTYPLFLLVSMGLSLHNGLAVIEGLLGIRTPFVRTPKFNLTDDRTTRVQSDYYYPRWTLMTVIEGLLAIYFTSAIIFGLWMHLTAMLVFHAMLAVGFGMVFYYSVKPLRRAL